MFTNARKHLGTNYVKVYNELQLTGVFHPQQLTKSDYDAIRLGEMIINKYDAQGVFLRIYTLFVCSGLFTTEHLSTTLKFQSNRWNMPMHYATDWTYKNWISFWRTGCLPYQGVTNG